MINAATWREANLQLVAKSLQELSYEQVIIPEEVSSNSYRLTLKSDVVYTFTAWKGIWTDLKIQRESILRNGQAVDNAGQFFVDSQHETAMTDIILGNFLEEMHNSLYADLALQEKSKKHLVNEVAHWSGEKIQTILSGHPKILISKGRVGWSASDQDHFGPEHEKSLQLLWLAAKIENTLHSFADQLSTEILLHESFDDVELKRFKEQLKVLSLDLQNYAFIPVHPWQWDRYIKIQFAGDLQNGKLVFLGAFGDQYLPQISLRTFSNTSRPEKMDIKLPITILNTSSIRGIPAKYVPQGPKLSTDLSALCRNDPFLNTSNTMVLEEKAGAYFAHNLYSRVKGAPYRYHEFLAAIWRQSAPSLLNKNEKAIIAGSLFYQDAQKKSLIGAYIQASGLTTEAWLRRYFESIILPLYHLQLQHGIGLVAHGQNVVIRLKDYVPQGLLLKDFQGDLRLTLSSTALEHDLTRLPAHYLIHDLITGHFVTVLRYISETLQSCDGFHESDFYRLLGDVLINYLNQHSDLLVRSEFAGTHLLHPTFPRVLVNRVRFKIGYADSAERPLPILGDELKNPIYLGLHHLRHDGTPL